MRRELNKMPIRGTIVFGEGGRDKAPTLLIGEKIGRREPLTALFDIFFPRAHRFPINRRHSGAEDLFVKLAIRAFACLGTKPCRQSRLVEYSVQRLCEGQRVIWRNGQAFLIVPCNQWNGRA